MRIYLATKFENTEAYHKLKKEFEADGHEITFDWTQHKIDESKMTEQEKDRFYQVCAYDDFFGVSSCDALVLIAYPGMAGAFAELGIALGLNKKIVVIDWVAGPRNIFYWLPNVFHVKTTEQALGVINRWSLLPHYHRPQPPVQHVNGSGLGKVTKGRKKQAEPSVDNNQTKA